MRLMDSVKCKEYTQLAILFPVIQYGGLALKEMNQNQLEYLEVTQLILLKVWPVEHNTGLHSVHIMLLESHLILARWLPELVVTVCIVYLLSYLLNFSGSAFDT